jgi:hypothetical protein
MKQKAKLNVENAFKNQESQVLQFNLEYDNFKSKYNSPLAIQIPLEIGNYRS